MFRVNVDVKLSPDFAKKATVAMEKKMEEHIRARLRDIRCAVHGQAATVIRRSSSKVAFDIHGCCPALREAATKALK
jgi:hypothetical protein